MILYMHSNCNYKCLPVIGYVLAFQPTSAMCIDRMVIISSVTIVTKVCKKNQEGRSQTTHYIQ